MKLDLVNIGSFLTTSGKLRITDPCYDRNVVSSGIPCAGVVDNCVRGVWNAYTAKKNIFGWGERNIVLVVKSADKHAVTEWEPTNIDVGVDSGQAGIFDEDRYQTDLKDPMPLTGNKEYNRNWRLAQIKEAEEQLKDIEIPAILGDFYRRKLEDSTLALEEFDKQPVEVSTDFYRVCCDRTLSNLGAGTIEFGAVSSSGFGDGSYSAAVRRDENGHICEVMIDFLVDHKEDDEEIESEEEIQSGTYFQGGKL